ncbi:MAG: secretin N-terminal domain-containing protein [Phycisphaerae bacterium]
MSYRPRTRARLWLASGLTAGLLLWGFSPGGSSFAGDAAPSLQQQLQQAQQQTDTSRAMLQSVLSTLLQPGDRPVGPGGATRAAAPVADVSDTVIVPPSDDARPADATPDGSLTVHAAGTVDVHISNMEISAVLRMISEQTRRNIIASKGVAGSGTVSASLYGVTLEKALEAILTSNGLGYRRVGDIIYVHTREELAAIAGGERQAITRVFRLRFVTAKDAEALITPLLSQTGRISRTPSASEGLGSANPNGGGAGAGGGGGGGTGGDSHANAETLVVIDFPENIKRIETVLREFDVRPLQVLVESTILRAQLNEQNALGIDFTTVGGVDFAELSSTSPGAQSIATGLIPNESLQNTNFTVRTGFNNNVPGGGFTFGIIKDQISVFIRALEQITDVTVLANPKILALNKQKGEVIVGRRDGYLTTTITETTAVQSVEFLETGTRLIFRPFVYGDGLIRMEIHPEDSTGGITAANLPFKQTTEVTTNIMLRDGHTVLIGGLFREVSNATRSQVPLLGNIPVAGALFRSTNDSLNREEIIILLTVHVVKGEADERAGDEALQDVERYRTSQRKAAEVIDRERLSQAHYHWALQHLARGDTKKALWDAELAIHNNPRHLQAIELREKLLSRRSWDEESSAVRGLVRDLISQENGRVEPSYGRPAPPFKLPEGFEGPTGLDGVEDEPRRDAAPATSTGGKQ